MKAGVCISMLLMPLLCGCFGNSNGGERIDTVLSSVANPGHTWRATVIERQYIVDGHFDNSPTTYVLMDRDAGKPKYENGEEFKDSHIAMKTSRCGPLSVRWTDDSTLQVTCVKCGLALSAVEEHTQGMGAIRIVYADFPAQSSWEAVPQR